MNILSESLRQYCLVNNITTRRIATQVGTTHTTVARFLQGKDVAQDTYLKLLLFFSS